MSHTHHEDVAAVTIHFHEDEVLATAKWMNDGYWQLTDREVELAKALQRRVSDAARDVLHADRAKRRAPKA